MEGEEECSRFFLFFLSFVQRVCVSFFSSLTGALICKSVRVYFCHVILFFFLLMSF